MASVVNRLMLNNVFQCLCGWLRVEGLLFSIQGKVTAVGPTVGPSSPAAVLWAWAAMTQWFSSNWTDPDQHNTCSFWQSTCRPTLLWGYCAIIPQDRLVVVPCALRDITSVYHLCIVQTGTMDEGSFKQSYKEQRRRTRDSGSRENNRLECPLCSWICSVQYFSVSVSQQMNHIINSDDCRITNQCLFPLPFFKGPKELTLNVLWSLDFFSTFFLDLTELM